MATNIDKSLSQAPAGLPDTAGVESIEIEIIPDGGEGAPTEEEATEHGFDDNLAETLEPSVLQSLASELSTDIDNDKMSRKDWEKTYVEGLKLLGLQYEDRTEPWDGACGVFHPLITEAVVRFQSEAITETFPAQGPARTKLIGKETPDKVDAARRVEGDMNYELTDVMHEFRPEHERMLWNLPAAGSAFKKVYFDPSLGRQTSVFVPAEDVLLPYGCTDLNTAYRVTHVMRKTANDIRKLQDAGFYRDFPIDDTPPREADDIKQAKDKETGFSDINDERYVLYESHVDLIVKGDTFRPDNEVAVPYVFTMIKGTNEVLAVRRNWCEEDEKYLKRQHFVHYQYIPGFGAYGFGLFHLIGGFAKSATSIMRQLVDAGTLSNLPGGMKTRALRIKGDDTPIAPGEFRDVDVGSGTLRDNILPLPYKEPSATLYNLLNTIVEEGRRFAATADMKVADMSAQAPVGTTLALLERQLKVMTAIQARLHYSMKQELRLLAEIIRDHTPEAYDYDPEGADDAPSQRGAKRGDYAHVDIIPVSDPNASTMSQRIIQYQAVIQLSQSAPQIYDMPKLHRGMLEVLGIKNAEKLVPLPEDQKPRDPVSENMAVLKGTPVKAFQYQDHESHIRVHMAAMQDPVIMQLIGQNPQAQAMQAAMNAHIAEHVGYAYRQKIEQQLGVPLPPEDEKLPPQIELALSGMMAQAAQQVLQQNQQQAAQQAAQQQAQDPVLQMQQQELKLKDRELDIKEKKVLGDLAAKSDDIELRAHKQGAEADLKTTGMVVDAAKHAAQLKEQRAARADQHLTQMTAPPAGGKTKE